MGDYYTAQQGVSMLPYILFGLIALISWIVQANLKRKFAK